MDIFENYSLLFSYKQIYLTKAETNDFINVVIIVLVNLNKLMPNSISQDFNYYTEIIFYQ